MTLIAKSLPSKCSNLECTNAMGEGLMVMVQSSDQCVGGHRGLSILMCGPCAKGLGAVEERRL